MAKISYEDRIDIYNKIKNGESPTKISKQYTIGIDKVSYLIRLIDKHGFDILRTTKNRKFDKFEKEKIINRVLLDGETVLSVSANEGLLSTRILFEWIKKYKEKIERLEKENEYLKAELEYSKKLRAVVQARKNQQQKKK